MSRMVRWLLVGIGDIATKRVLPAILKESHSTLAGLVTRSAPKAQFYAVPAFADLVNALAIVKPDLVYISTPVALHAEQTITALRAGAHVLCEKPMAMNYREALTMQKTAEETGRTLGVAYYRRKYPKVERARTLLEQGVIGRPVFAAATSHDWFYPTDGFRAWLVDPRMSGGGPLRDIASHRLDLMNYFFGTPQDVCGQVSTLVQPVEVEDNATIMMQHATGVRSVVDVRWHSRISRDEFLIRGTEGEMNLTPLNGPALVYPGGEEEVPAPQNLHFPCVEDFVAAVLDGRPSISTGATALETEWAMDCVAGRER